MVFGEQMVYMMKDSFVFEDDMEELSPKNMSDHDLISLLHKIVEDKFKALKHIYPRNEQKFKEIVELIYNTVALYLSENIFSPGKTRTESLEGTQHRIELIESVFGEKFSEKVQPVKNVFRLQYERSLEESVPVTKNLEGDQKSVNTSGTQNVDPDYMTRKEVLDYLRITPKTLWLWEKKGAIPKGIRVGGKKLFKRDELMAFIKKSNGLME
jgi:predicted DNA-binding transcriptional regulator AlpA